ncbi:MAG: ATPase [Firmicutes bacterium]|nr:ATPase [Bacillota bacterium]
MRVFELLDEIDEIIDTASGFPMTDKVLIHSEEILEIVKQIRVELPEEMQQAKWIKDERQRILDDAKKEYEDILTKAQAQAEALIENDDIVVRAKKRADEIMTITEENCKNLKMQTFDYVDSILYNFQEKMEQLSAMYLGDMVGNLEKSFDAINQRLSDNRNEVKEMAYRAQAED